MTYSKKVLLLLLLLVPALMLAACDTDDAEDSADDVATEVSDAGEDVEDAAENAAEDIEDAAEDVGDDLDETAEDVEDAAEDAVNDLNDETEDIEDADITEDIEDAAEDAADELDEATEDVEDTAEDFVDDIDQEAEDLFDDEDQDMTLVEYLRDHSDFTTFVSLIDAAHLTTDTYVDDSMPLTIIAPTDEAFENLMDSLDMTLAEFEAEHPEMVQDLLMYHSLDGRYTLDDLEDMDGENVMTTSGQEISVRVEDETVFLDDIEVISDDDSFESGAILAVEEVLLPLSMRDLEMNTS